MHFVQNINSQLLLDAKTAGLLLIQVLLQLLFS